MCSTSSQPNTSLIKSSSKNQNKLLKTNDNSQLKQKFSKFVKRLIPPCNYCKPKNKKRQQIKNKNIEKMEEEELNKEINLNKNEIKSKIPFTSNFAAAARLQEQMGLGTPKFPVQWVLGSSELTEEENSDKNNFVYIKNTFDKKLFFFHGKDENENKSQTTNSSSLFNQNSLQNQDKNNENKQQILLKEEQQNIEDLPKKRKKSFKICKCFPTVVRVIVESGANEREEEIEERQRIITSSSSTSQLQLNNTNIFTTKHSLTIMASSSSSSCGGGGGGGGGGISRFRIIPVNSNYYKKGRWQVWDYYNEGIVDKKTTNINNILQPKENKIGKVKEREEEEQKKENINSPEIGNTSFNYKKESEINPPPPSILSLQNIPTSTSQKLMPRRNSFQLITIKTLEDKNSLNSVPSSISEERLNLIGVNDNTKENNLIKNWIKQQNSSEFITFPPPNQNNKTPQIVEESPQKLSEFPSSPLLNNYQPISIESTTTTNLISTIPSPLPSPNSLSPNIKSISTSPPPPKQMFIQPPPPSSLERQLSVGLNEKEIKENNNSSPQYFSASFGPGQIQFNGNMNGVGGQNYVEERRRSIARRGSSASTGAVPSTIQQQKVDAGVNIDYKIEQAMDLVKTHLIYAVRDEIELLKSRIVELESNVFHLESENAKLREHIPKEVLANICFDNIQQQFNKQKILFSINNIASNK